VKRYLAFDMETAKVLPSDARDLLQHRPLGIACATAFAEADTPNSFHWYGLDVNNRPVNQMTCKEAEKLVIDLMELSAKGYTLLTWGGTGFDFDVLAEESGRIKECASLAKNHVDMMFHILCSLGYPVSLQKAAEGMNLSGKKNGISGALAPSMWAAGQCEEVLEYCMQDARLTLQIAMQCEQYQQFTWKTRRGTTGQLALPNGWLTVQEAYNLPLPDTSWMDNPLSRNDIIRWLSKDTPI